MAVSDTTSSKREALRFPGFDKTVKYKTEFEDGQATLDNISTSGCALTNLSVPLSLNERLLILITLTPEDQPLSIQARVRREESNLYGLEFFNITDDVKQQLIRFFAMENRRRKLQQTT